MDKKKAKTLEDLEIPHKFEIAIEEADWDNVPDGQPPNWRPVRMDKPVIVTVSSKKEFRELIDQYKIADQRIHIIREIDPPTKDQIIEAANKQGIELPPNFTKSVATPMQQPAAQPMQQPAAQPMQQTELQQHMQQVPVQQKQKPKIVTIGDVQIKYDGNDVYQRQWLKLTPAESANLRLVNDSTNKIVSLAGKHFEAKKWVKVETEQNSDDISEALADE